MVVLACKHGNGWAEFTQCACQVFYWLHIVPTHCLVHYRDIHSVSESVVAPEILALSAFVCRLGRARTKEHNALVMGKRDHERQRGFAVQFTIGGRQQTLNQRYRQMTDDTLFKQMISWSKVQHCIRVLRHRSGTRLVSVYLRL